MADLEDLRTALEPLLATMATLDLSDPEHAKAELDRTHPIDADRLQSVRQLVREGMDAGWLADREAGGIRFSRVRKAPDEDAWSIEAVHMDRPGPGHTHPRGEVDLCFAVSGDPRFDGAVEGWTVYPAESWHVPTVTGGVMDILYFLPGGKIRFEPKPD